MQSSGLVRTTAFRPKRLFDPAVARAARGSAFTRSERAEPATTYREQRRRSASLPLISDLPLALRQDFEQVANLPLFEEGMPQGKLRLDLVAVPPALPLARHVALVY